jgi:EAL domain-containing protein (putative c-di-GMP-specific phosphodiesterase class I)
MEALVRWQHPILGLMGPGEFLPLVESDDALAREVGIWVMQHAIEQAAAWRRAGLNIPVSINVFVQQLRDVDFPLRLQALLTANPDLPSNQICIEILENTALDDFSSVTRLIQFCAHQGIRFALDDFGTGFSSLTYLRRLPVNSLKIDQSFVRDMLQDPDDLTIVEGVIGLGKAFRHQVVAEGVESAEHALMLMEMGCNLVQGFGIARPMPSTDTEAWLKNFQPDPRWLENAAQRLSRDDFQLILAEVNHRQWLASLQNWMRQDPEHRQTAPPLNSHDCNFGRWYYGEGARRYAQFAEFHAVEGLHENIHLLAQQLVSETESGATASSRETEAGLLHSAEIFVDALTKIRSLVKYNDAGQ